MSSPKVDTTTPQAGVDLKQMARGLRRSVLEMIYQAGSGHPGGSLSAVEVVTALFFCILRHRPQDPGWSDRDRFILSKGHAVPLLYAVLAQMGYFPSSELSSLRRLDSRLQGHPDRDLSMGIETSTGSLGQGLSFGVGVALAGKLDQQDYRVYVLLGNGECDEGQVWEAAMSAAHFKLDNLTAVVDHNRQQLDGWTKDVMDLGVLKDKWSSFGWEVMEIDGHNFDHILSAFEKAKEVKGKPTVIISHTTKGKGVSFMENNPDFHGRAPTREEMEKALEEL